MNINKQLLVVTYIKRSILSNIQYLRLDKNIDKTEKRNLKRGGALLWYKYYRNVYYGEEQLNNVYKRLLEDLEVESEDINYMKAYIKRCGSCWILPN